MTVKIRASQHVHSRFMSGIFRPRNKLEKRSKNRAVRRMDNLTTPGAYRKGTLHFEWN